MLNIKLTNIYNDGRMLYLFHRDKKELQIMKDQTFFPYLYEPSSNGVFRGYNKESLQKIFVKEPYQITRKRSSTSMESDIIYTKRYLIDKINIEKTTLRWVLFDIECKTAEFPDISKADKPISCIVCYDNYTEKKTTFWLPNYGSEYEMIEAFIQYIKSIKPDLMIAWNGINFDYIYLYNRIPDFSKRISPIGKEIFHNKFPAGISIIDYMSWDKKMTSNKRKSYALEIIANEELGTPLNEKVDFNSLNEEIRIKCEADVGKMVKLEEKKQYISLFDDIRIMSKCLWDDMDWNSHIIDQLVLQEAKKKGIVLPRKASYETFAEQTTETKFEGAFRDAFETGLFNNIGKYDLSGAYLYAIVDLCLDSTNILEENTKDSISVNITDRKSQDIIESYNIKQNSEAILPTLARKLIHEKIRYKDLLKKTDPSSSEYKEIEGKYNAIKTIFLSAWGVIGNRGFRLYDIRIAGMITATVRNLVHYVNDELHKIGYKVIYIDTDSVFCDDKGNNISDLLNKLIQKWAQERFGKSSSIGFEYEGHFNSLFILAKCHYVGNLQTKKGIKKEIKGIEAKRKDSTVFMAKTQMELINLVLAGKSQEECSQFVNNKLIECEQADILDIAFPCRISADKEYKNEPIFLRALKYTIEINSDFVKRPGDLYYWIYVNPFGIEEKEALRTVKGEKKTVIVKKKKDVLAFDKDIKGHVKDINWNKMKERNILTKAKNIFGAMGWELHND